MTFDYCRINQGKNKKASPLLTSHLIHYMRKESRGCAAAGRENCCVLPQQVNQHGCWGEAAQGQQGICPFANSFYNFIQASNQAKQVLKEYAGFFYAQQKQMGLFGIHFSPSTGEAMRIPPLPWRESFILTSYQGLLQIVRKACRGLSKQMVCRMLLYPI